MHGQVLRGQQAGGGADADDGRAGAADRELWRADVSREDLGSMQTGRPPSVSLPACRHICYGIWNSEKCIIQLRSAGCLSTDRPAGDRVTVPVLLQSLL